MIGVKVQLKLGARTRDSRRHFLWSPYV